MDNELKIRIARLFQESSGRTMSDLSEQDFTYAEKAMEVFEIAFREQARVLQQKERSEKNPFRAITYAKQAEFLGQIAAAVLALMHAPVEMAQKEIG